MCKLLMPRAQRTTGSENALICRALPVRAAVEVAYAARVGRAARELTKDRPPREIGEIFPPRFYLFVGHHDH